MQNLPLFEKFPGLSSKLPFIKLGNFPTPVTKLERLGKELGIEELYVKRDDLSSHSYGGNKVRKLEFLLASAQKEKAKVVLAIGAAGSHYVLATTIFAHLLGIKTIALLFPQLPAQYVRDNLLLDYHFGADLNYVSHIALLPLGLIKVYLKSIIKYGEMPYYLPPGGSSPLGCVGYINAVGELKQQITAGILPEPDYIFVALGTGGTSAGIELGKEIFAIKSCVISVQVVDKIISNAKNLSRLINKTSRLLNQKNPDFPLIFKKPSDLKVLGEYFGGAYARFIPKAVEAVRLISSYEDIRLENTYTGKAFAGLIEHVKKNSWEKKVILFWNTYNSVDLSNFISPQNFYLLPKSLRWYFKVKTQDENWGI